MAEWKDKTCEKCKWRMGIACLNLKGLYCVLYGKHRYHKACAEYRCGGKSLFCRFNIFCV